jgi:uncharacterized protein
VSDANRRSLHPVWEWLDRPGLEAAEFTLHGDRIAIEGIVVTTLDEVPIRLRYALDLDSSWVIREAQLGLEAGLERRTITLTHDLANWIVNGTSRPDLSGCNDIDIMGSPSTNTLPIRRLRWQPGQARDFRMAYIRLPDLVVMPVAQRYTCLNVADPMPRHFEYTMPARTKETASGPQRFGYHSVDSGFRAELRLDEDGLVLDYPPYWRRVR